MSDRDDIIEEILKTLSDEELATLEQMKNLRARLREAGVDRAGYNLATPKTRRRVAVGAPSVAGRDLKARKLTSR